MMKNVVFLLEEISTKDFLVSFLKARGVTKITPHYLVFEGKSDLKKQLLRKLRGWRQPRSQFIVICDQNRGDCVRLKQELWESCRKARRSEAIIRIVCRELERLILGYRKRDGARRIAPLLQPERSRSRSFQVLARTIEQFTTR